MYMQKDIAAAAVPKFHIDEPRIDPANRQAEIEQVITLATAVIPKAQMKKLGRLSFAAARDDDDYSYFGQIRSEAIGNSGLEFRFSMPARDTGHNDLTAIAAEVAEGAIRIARTAGGLRKIASSIRENAESALKPAASGIAQMRVVAVGITPEPHVKITVDVEMLCDDLSLGIERVSEQTSGGGLDRLEERLATLAAKHIERRSALAQAKVAGATGWIDDSAVRILEISGLGRATALEMLRHDRQIDFCFGGDRGYDFTGGVYWDDGVVRGYVENRDRANPFRLEAKVLTIEANRLPASVIANLLGRHLGEVIDIDFIPGNSLIVGVEEWGEWLYLRLEIGRTLINDKA
jgi:hypothetical protein